MIGTFKAITVFIILSSLISCNQNSKMNMSDKACNDNCKTESKSKELSCKLTSPELRERKATVIASLKQQVVDKKELPNGYAFKFAGNDEVLDELVEFIKTERECCDFFTFAISVSGDKTEAWLELTGEKGVKEFITSELEF